MDKPSSRAQAAASPRSEKKVRKGTRSCTECRRRKIRCVFSHGSPVCSPCAVRGNRCVDQRQQPFAVPQAEPSHGLVSNVLDETSDSDLPVNSESGLVPLISVIADSECWSAGTETNEPTAKTSQALHDERESMGRPGMSQSSQRKANEVCQALRSAMPNYDVIMSRLSGDRSWWHSFRFKTHLNASEPAEALASFAARTYTSSNPALLGTLATAYARSLNRYHRIYTIVDRLVVSDFEYASTIEGMHCLIFLAKSLTEIGHPRRSWLIWRKGLAVAQLIGLYRDDAKRVLANNIWWMVYHGDKFTSLLLGVPHGFNDNYYASRVANDESPLDKFILQGVLVVGKLVDRNLVPGHPSVAQTLSLDEQLDSASALLPEAWWNVPDGLSGLVPNDELRERVLLQFYFFHIRVYLYLPFMAKSAATSTSVICRLACREASRQLLKRFLLLRSTIHGACLFECKTTSFISFMGAIVLILGLEKWGQMPTVSSSDDDIDLLTRVKAILGGDVEKDGCKVSSQCCRALEILMASHRSDGPNSQWHGKEDKMLIPYFGTIMHRRTTQTSDPSVDEGWQGDAQVPSATSISSGNPGGVGEPLSFEYTGSSLGFPMMGHLGFMGENTFHDDALRDTPWFDPLVMDLDQDWNLFPTFGEN
ncbi:hypothetical protein B0T10DRAFT_101098 [Thelonectria olida]|uniref:Zn(2)-C6 fungal-type domain-containing protein n=1 Tax=Thelonectria olida TaxID=1576542 RepID=A0A9P9AVG3_9HYPO|nr:hypothetical protein B0T10DRAFT_101098 [Thelonectria olida]